MLKEQAMRQHTYIASAVLGVVTASMLVAAAGTGASAVSAQPEAAPESVPESVPETAPEQALGIPKREG